MPVEKPSKELYPLLEPNFQQMESTQFATAHKSDSKREINSSLEEQLSPIPQSTADASIPTPFKKILFWPTPQENNAKRKVKKDKVSAVATSSQWQQYSRQREEKKRIKRTTEDAKEAKAYPKERKGKPKQESENGYFTKFH